MEWVETTGRTIEDAKEAALDQLGIDESEAEFEVLEEPKTGLFGRPRGEARLRARVVPKAPRPKQERRPRRGRSGGSGNGGGRKEQGTPAPAAEPASADEASPEGDADQGRNRRGGKRRGGESNRRGPKPQEGNHMTEDDVPVGVQADIITEFLEGLLVAFGVEGTVTRTEVDDETIELSVDGEDLGLLIGPKGQTLTAVHELSRTVLQRRATGRHVGRVRIDIGGYRQRRQEALARFVQQQAEQVLAEGTARALEPMNSADRKVVHDTVNEIEGVATVSEGADPDRRVVIVLDAAGE
ncbi:MAG: Jag N-terminal domain-containing protein [Acidimicrobiales bacterium]|nr:Jag N-terminal domain-containing protein [Acidimicrobiales bacterium]